MKRKFNNQKINLNKKINLYKLYKNKKIKIKHYMKKLIYYQIKQYKYKH